MASRFATRLWLALDRKAWDGPVVPVGLFVSIPFYVLGGLFLLMVLGVIPSVMSCSLDAVGAYLRATVTVRVARGTENQI